MLLRIILISIILIYKYILLLRYRLFWVLLDKWKIYDIITTVQN